MAHHDNQTVHAEARDPERLIASPRPAMRRLLAASAAILSAAAALLVTREGQLAWQVVRAVVVLAAGAGVVLCLLRASRGWVGWAALVPGLLGTAAGAGVGVPHAMDVGFGLPTAAGLAALVSGLVLLVGGIVLLFGGLPPWWRLLAIPGVIVLLLILLPLTLAVAATNVPPDPEATRTPAELGLAYQDVDLTTTDGIHLSAWYVPSTNGASVILLHGSGSTRVSTLAHASVLAKHGYGVLLLDTRGHGRSGGTAMDFGWYGDADIASAVDFLGTRPDVRGGRIAVLGLSMGGEEALGAAAFDDRIHAVIAEGATNRVLADRAWLPRHVGGWLQRGMDWLMFGVADLLSGASPPIGLRGAVVAIAPRPVLLIAGGQMPDETVAADFYRAASPANVTVWSVPGSPHIGALSTAPAGWESRVIRFLEDALSPRLSA